MVTLSASLLSEKLMNLRTIQKASVFFLLLVSMLMPSKMGMGQVMNDWKEHSPVGLAQPRGVCPGLRGELYIADTDNNRVLRINLDGTVTTLGSPGSAVGQFAHPQDLDIDSQ